MNGGEVIWYIKRLIKIKNNKMKNSMKNLFLFLLLPFCFACNNDDDPIVPEVNFEEKIVGTWQLIGREPNGVEFCELSNIFQFSQEGQLFLEVFISDDNGGCRSASASGTWDYLGGNKIEVDLAGVEENAIAEILFFDNYTAFKLIGSSNEEGHYETYAKQ